MDNYTALLRRLAALEQRMEKASIADRVRPVVARYETAAGQSIAHNTLTIIDFGTSVYDPDSHVTTGAAWKFTAQIPGYYHVHAAIIYASTTTWALGEAADIRLYKGGIMFSSLARDDAMNSATTAQLKALVGADLVYLAAGEYVDVRTVQGSGAALTLHPFAVVNYIAIQKVS